MNETWKNPTEATYMEDTIYVEKDRKKGKKERKKNMETSIYENRMKETKKKHKIIPTS